MKGVPLSIVKPGEIAVAEVDPVDFKEEDKDFKLTLPIVLSGSCGILAIGGVALRALWFRHELDAPGKTEKSDAGQTSGD